MRATTSGKWRSVPAGDRTARGASLHERHAPAPAWAFDHERGWHRASDPISGAGDFRALLALAGYTYPVRLGDPMRRWGLACTCTPSGADGRSESALAVAGDKWVAKWAKEDGGVQVESGILKIVNPENAPLAVDLKHLGGPHKGSTVYAIVREDSGTLKCCYRDRAEDRPTKFVTKPGDMRCGLVTYNHQKR